MDLFMPAERVLYDRAYYLSDEAERDYAFEVAEEHGIDVGEVLYSVECFPSYSEKAAKGVDDAVQAVKAYRLEGKRVHREVIPGYLYETAKAAAAKTAGGADGGTGPHI